MRSTTDIWFASFLKLKGFEIKDFESPEKFKGKFFFNLNDKQWKEMKLAFETSDISKIKLIQISLKDLLH